MVSFDSDAALTYKGKANQMNISEIGAVLIGLSALFGYINHRFLRLPHTIGLVMIALAASLSIIAIEALSPTTQIAKPRHRYAQSNRFSRGGHEWNVEFLAICRRVACRFLGIQVQFVGHRLDGDPGYFALDLPDRRRYLVAVEPIWHRTCRLCGPWCLVR